MDKKEHQTPVIVDLGKRKRRDIKDLRNGHGYLMEEVDQAVARARSGLPDAEQNKPVVPVVILYRKKRKRRGSKSIPFSPLNPLSMCRF